MHVIAIFNLKGGVAKTMTAAALSHTLWTMGHKVLMLDNDKQGDLSRDYKRRTLDGKGMDAVLMEGSPDVQKLIRHTDYEGLDIIPANRRLLHANLKLLSDGDKGVNKIKDALHGLDYDFCIIDNAPDISTSVANAINAADDIIIPIEIDNNTSAGIDELMEDLKRMSQQMGVKVKRVGCLITRYDNRNEAHKQGAEFIKAKGLPVFDTKIRVSKKAAESTFDGVITKYSPRCAAAVDYRKFVKEYVSTLDTGEGKENV